MSTRETILAAVQTALVNASVASGRVYRSRQEAIDIMPSVVVEPQFEAADETVLGMLDRSLNVSVVVFACGTATTGSGSHGHGHAHGSSSSTSVAADTAADDTLALVESTLLADRTLGLGSEVQIRSILDIRWDFEDQDTARVTATFQVSYRTAL